MFKRFSQDDISSSSQIKSSVQRGIRAKLLEQFPACEVPSVFRQRYGPMPPDMMNMRRRTVATTAKAGGVAAAIGNVIRHHASAGNSGHSGKSFFDLTSNIVADFESMLEEGQRRQQSRKRGQAYLDEILPKKGNITVAKCKDRISLICCDDAPLFFQQRDGIIFPTLRILHKYPNMMPTMRVDKGAISFVMNGANIMCAGFTSKGGSIDTPLDAGSPVCITAEGKKTALAVGVTTMSTADIKAINKGSGVENLHYLGDGLFFLKTLD